MSSPRRYQQAFRSLNAFYKRLVDDLADKVVDREDSFEETYLGLGEEIVERYGHLLIRPEIGNLTRLKMRPDTVITRNGKPAKLSDLHANDKVRANYDSNNWVSELHATGA